jgi:predicted dehydrogenase
MNDVSKLKVAIAGVSHWHVPLYLGAIKRYNLDVISVADNDSEVAGKIAADLGCKAFSDVDALIEDKKPDFVIAFDKHCNMTKLAKTLIAHKIPFAMEKPIGLCSADVNSVKQLAAENGVYCSIPFVWRYTDLVRKMKQLILPEDILHMSFRFICGPTDRYVNTSPWLLDRKSAGGGCMTNLGVHFIDLAMLFTNSKSAKVIGSYFHYSHGYNVEDYAVNLLKMANGATAEIEVGYAYPMDDKSERETLWRVATKKGYYSVGEGYLEVREFNGNIEKLDMNTNSVAPYPVFVYDSLCEYLNNKKPTAGLDEMLVVRSVLDDLASNSKANA